MNYLHNLFNSKLKFNCNLIKPSKPIVKQAFLKVEILLNYPLNGKILESFLVLS